MLPLDLSLYSRAILAVCAVFSLVIGAEAVVMSSAASGSGTDSSEELQSSGTAAIAAATAVLRIPPVVSYREIMERPLFSDTRRPPMKNPAVTQAAPAAALSNTWKLTGVVVAGENSFVHVEGIRDGKTVRLQKGMPLGAWRLQTIASDHVVFASAGRSATLQLHDEEQPIRPPKRR